MISSALVTGASGFVGGALVRRLAAAGVPTTVLLREGGGSPAPDPKIETVRVRAFEQPELEAALAGRRFEVIFHLASYGVRPGARDPREMIHGNVSLTVELLLSVRGCGPRLFLHTGTWSEYGPLEAPAKLSESSPIAPTSQYGAAKAAAGMIAASVAADLGLSFATLRLFHVYGPGEAEHRLIPYLVRCLRRGDAPELTHGEQVRDFIHVDDVAEAFLAAANAEALAPGAYNVCTGDPVRVREVALAAGAAMGVAVDRLGLGRRPQKPGEPPWAVGDPARLFGGDRVGAADRAALGHRGGGAPRVIGRTGRGALTLVSRQGAKREGHAGAAVGFVLGTYLSFTETFLYQQMRSLSRYRPVILCGRLANEGRFPWSGPLYVAKKSPSRLSRAFGPLHRFARLDPGWRAAIGEQRMELLHGQFGTNGLVGAIYARRHRLPLVTSFYGGDVGYLLAPREHLRDQWHYLLGKRALFAASALVLVLSEAMRADLVRLGCPASKIRIQRNGVDLDRFRPDPSQPASGTGNARPVQVVMCGREIDKKGFDYAFRAVRKARDGGADLRVRWLTAPGPQGAALRALLDELELRPHVDELDPSTDPAPVMAGADLILCASVTADNGDKEGVPTVLVEAAACGLPAIATRHAGIPEIVGDGETGLLFPERDVDGLAAGLTRLAADAGLRRRLGEAARRKVEEGWDAKRLAVRLEQLYDEARDLAPRGATY